MLHSNNPMIVVKSNNGLNKNRSTIYKHKAKFFKYPDSQEVELELVSEKVQAELAQKLQNENRTRRIADMLTIILIIVAMSGVLIWLF